ncbi:MAG: hypothetical protein JW795_17745 [Chitinivibrionales bacterium]|nr:hypothetical protein [Chitinivibrionales bacterium]
MLFHELLRLLQDHQRLFRNTLLACIAISLLITFSIPSVYQSSARLYFIGNKESYNSNLFMVEDLSLIPLNSQINPLHNQMELILSRPVVDKTIEELHLSRGKKPLAYAQLRPALSVRPIPNTSILIVSCRYRDATNCAAITNGVVKHFIDLNQKITMENIRSVRLMLDAQIRNQKKLLEETEQTIANFRQSEGIVSSENDLQMKMATLSQLESELIRLQSELFGLQGEKEKIQKNIKSPDAPSSQFYERWISSLEQLNTKIDGIEARKKNLEALLRDTRRAINAMPPKEVKMDELVRKEMLLKELYTNLTTKAEEYKVQESMTLSNIKIIEQASVADHIFFPNRIKFLIVFFVFSLFAATLACSVRSVMKNNPKSLSAIRSIVNAPLAGAIAKVAAGKPLIKSNDPLDLFTESIIACAKNISQTRSGPLHAKSSPAVYFVTSAAASEGKTTVAANLSLYLRAEGKKVAFVDASYGQIKEHPLTFDQTVSIFTEPIVPMANTITLVHCGASKNLPLDLSTSTHLSERLEVFKNHFEAIVIDAPAISVGPSLWPTASMADAVLFVIDCERTDMRLVHLATVKAPSLFQSCQNLHIVINRLWNNSFLLH